ncbi:MAG: hypothetical protein MPJ24_00265 [Pirellulaceae bacterium]|nr:hypothetical protein [Pirellulaceae bacterium]
MQIQKKIAAIFSLEWFLTIEGIYQRKAGLFPCIPAMYILAMPIEIAPRIEKSA